MANETPIQPWETRCPSCGAGNGSTARFCSACATPLTARVAAQPGPPPQQQRLVPASAHGQHGVPVVVQNRRRRVWPWVLLGVAVVFVAGFVGCAALLNEAVDDLNAEQAAHAITQEQFDAITLGMTRDEVVFTLGKEPEDAQEFVTEGVFTEEELRSSCIYYNRVGESFGSAFQFCFDGDVLRSKNSY